MTNPAYFKTLLMLFGLVLFQSSTSYSQSAQSDLKLEEFDSKTEDAEAFKRKATAFLNGLRSFDSGTTGHVNLSTEEPLGKVLLKLADRNLAPRSVFLRPGIRSRNLTEKIEFWIVQKNSEGPFPIICGLCDCPTAQVSAKDRLEGSEAELTFTAEVSAGAKVSYRWSVRGGEIVTGQGTTKIIVRPKAGNDVIADVEWLGDENCGCRGTASFTSSFLRKQL